MPVHASEFPDQPDDDEPDVNQLKRGKPDENDGDKGAEDLGEDEAPPE
jgi:hypothetical protein